MKRLIIAVALITFALSGVAAIDAYPFPNEELRERYNALIDELRCPQCLNTNLAGSDAMIAQDLRREVHRLLLEGKSDDEILEFMHYRYGDFILYKPRVTPQTWALWFGPVLLLLVAGGFVIRIVRRREPTTDELGSAEQERLNALLSGSRAENE